MSMRGSTIPGAWTQTQTPNLATCQARQALNASAGAIGAVRSAGLCSQDPGSVSYCRNVAFRLHRRWAALALQAPTYTHLTHPLTQLIRAYPHS